MVLLSSDIREERPRGPLGLEEGGHLANEQPKQVFQAIEHRQREAGLRDGGYHHEGKSVGQGRVASLFTDKTTRRISHWLPRGGVTTRAMPADSSIAREVPIPNVMDTSARTPLGRLIRDTDGQDLIEYALLAGFVSLVAVAAITNVGTALNGVWGGVDTQMTAAAASAS